MSADILRERLLAFAQLHPEILGGDALPREEITKADFYEAGLSGGENSAARRDRLAVSEGLPQGMTANALLAALNTVMTRERFLLAVSKGDFTDDK